MTNTTTSVDHTQSASVPDRAEFQKQSVIDAAIRCFQQKGEQRTSIQDIAEEANISRRTCYRLFEDRPSLLQHVVVQILGDLRKKVRDQISQFGSVQDAIIEGSLYHVKVTIADKVFRDIMYHSTNYRIEKLLFSNDKIILNSLVEMWGDTIERGQREGVIKDTLTVERIVELSASCNASLLMRDDLSEDQRRRFLRDLLWAAIEK